jgi:hypothetical protein
MFMEPHDRRFEAVEIEPIGGVGGALDEASHAILRKALPFVHAYDTHAHFIRCAVRRTDSYGTRFLDIDFSAVAFGGICPECLSSVEGDA